MAKRLTKFQRAILENIQGGPSISELALRLGRTEAGVARTVRSLAGRVRVVTGDDSARVYSPAGWDEVRRKVRAQREAVRASRGKLDTGSLRKWAPVERADFADLKGHVTSDTVTKGGARIPLAPAGAWASIRAKLSDMGIYGVSGGVSINGNDVDASVLYEWEKFLEWLDALDIGNGPMTIEVRSADTAVLSPKDKGKRVSRGDRKGQKARAKARERAAKAQRALT